MKIVCDICPNAEMEVIKTISTKEIKKYIKKHTKSKINLVV